MYKNIVLINTFGVGDVLFTTPIIHTLKASFKDLKIGYLCNSRAKELLRNNPYVDHIFVYDRDEFEAIKKKSLFAWLKKIDLFAKEIKKEDFELALDFSLNTEYGFFSWLAGIKERIGYNYKNRGRFLTKKIGLTGYSQKHIAEYYNDLLFFLGIEPKFKNLELYVNEKDKCSVNELLAKNGINNTDFLVGVIPGGGKSWGKDAFLKHWQTDKFSALGDKIVENYKAKIIILGDSSEADIALKLKSQMNHETVDLSGKTSLGELAALLERMSLVIANDGGPLHMAVALGRKTVSFFGPVDPNVYGPYPPNPSRHIVLHNAIDCSPCYRNFRLEDCKRNRDCLEGVSVEEALKAVSKLLSESKE